jgi:glucose-6-phosphate-specific signal transduction histidine kinase
MEIKTLDFLVGLSVGAILGTGLTVAVSRLRRWLGYSEAGRLQAENRQLKKRLAEKDRHIGRMLSETERLAEKLAKNNSINPSGKGER